MDEGSQKEGKRHLDMGAGVGGEAPRHPGTQTKKTNELKKMALFREASEAQLTKIQGGRNCFLVVGTQVTRVHAVWEHSSLRVTCHPDPSVAPDGT